MKPRIVSLFSGLGGIDAGFHAAGFETVFATDIWPLACKSLKANFPSAEVVADDVSKLDFSLIKKKYGKIAGLVGGPPCPSFSKSRFYLTSKDRGIADEIGYLTVSNYFRALEEIQPDFFFFENVHGFVYKPHASALEYIRNRSRALGYKLSFRVVNAADYGVAQTRERFICVGVRKDLNEFSFPAVTHSENPTDLTIAQKWVTCGDVLGDLDFDLPEDPLMEAGSKHKDLLKLVPPGDNYLYFTKERGYPTPLFEWRSRYWSFLLKLSPNRPSWTIQASHSNNMGPFHWKNRFLRIPEVKRIQSFDDSYQIFGSFRDQWRQLGNAVPPKLVFHFASKIFGEYY
jgi:DNA (cytosine-5)-methyltransferase 1